MTTLTDAEVEQKIRDILMQFETPSLIQLYFSDVIVSPSDATQSAERRAAVQEVVQFLKGLPIELTERAVKSMLNGIGANLRLELLERLLLDSVFSMKGLSELILSSLTPDRAELWLDAIAFISAHLNKLDYKGARDLLKLILPLVQLLPSSLDVNSLKLFTATQAVIETICDRSNNLLPAYFVINEIKKFYPEQRFFPHWMLADLFANILDSFRPLAQMVTVIGRPYFFPTGNHCGFYCSSSWKLDPFSLRIPLKGFLPYKTDYVAQPQVRLMYNLMLQYNSKDLVTHVMGMPKTERQRCGFLEDVLISAILHVMELAETDHNYSRYCDRLWQHLSSQLIFFVIHQFAVFPHILEVLNAKLSVLPYRKARDELMWMLLQFLSGGIQKSPVTEFTRILDLHGLLYTGEEQLTINGSDLTCVKVMAPTCIWIHLTERMKKDEKIQPQSLVLPPIPPSINTQMKFLQERLANSGAPLSTDDYIVSVLCNAYSTTSEIFQSRLLNPVIVEKLYQTVTSNSPALSLPGGVFSAENKLTPLSYDFLDSVTIHVKMNIVHNLFSYFFKYTQKFNVYPSPAAVETYSRLLPYSEIETLGIRQFVTKLIPTAFTSPSGIDLAFILTEILLYRFRVQNAGLKLQAILCVNNGGSSPRLCNNSQLYWSMENLILRGFLWMNSAEMVQVFSRLMPGILEGSQEGSGPQGILTDTEELTKVLVYSMARTIRVSGPEISPLETYREFVTRLINLSPHSWPSSTLQLFPSVIAELYPTLTSAQIVDKKMLLKRQIEDDVRKWPGLCNENNINGLIEYFTHNACPSLLCVIARLICDDLKVPPQAFRVVEAIGPRIILPHLRALCDHLVYEFNPNDNNRNQKLLDAVSEMVWKYFLFPFERLLLTLLLRPFDGPDSTMALYLCNMLIMKQSAQSQLPSIGDRIHFVVQNMTPDFWLSTDFFEKHLEYHRRFPEKYWSRRSAENQPNSQGPIVALPVYLGNCCFRLLPVFDLLIQRLCESPSPSTSQWLDSLLDMVGGLYKFHPQPVTFLYNTLFIAEKKLNEFGSIKRKLILTIQRAFASIRHDSWLVTPEFFHLTEQQNLSVPPELDYFVKAVVRLVDAQKLNPPIYFDVNWRFGEFLNALGMALHSVCCELMALPFSGAVVGKSLVDIVLKCNSGVAHADILTWHNCLGLIFTALPICYSEPLFLKIAEVLERDDLLNSTDIFRDLDFETNSQVVGEKTFAKLLALIHSVCHHATTGYLLWVPQFLRANVKAKIRTEAQFIFICHLFGPFLQRWHAEKVKHIMDVATDIYEMLLAVDRNSEELRHENVIVDLLYHMKYMFVGDGIKPETDRIISQLRPSLQLKLRYISHQHLVDTAGSVTSATG